jgi:hypothetical protein
MNVQQLAERVIAESLATGEPLAEVARRVLEEAWGSLSDQDKRELLVCGLAGRFEGAEFDAGRGQEDGHE